MRSASFRLTCAAHLFFQLISRRYELGPMVITQTTVLPNGALFGDRVIATAILDRLPHHSHALTIRGDSYRLRAKRKSGLIKAPNAGDDPPVGSAPPSSPSPAETAFNQDPFPIVGAVLHDAKGAVPDGV